VARPFVDGAGPLVVVALIDTAALGWAYLAGWPWTSVLGLHLAVASVAAFALFGLDKWLARTKRRRLREAGLLMLGLAGGAAGALAAMSAFRHKTRHWRFRIGMPVALVGHVVAVVWVWP
jgi:uncharacterized membrane protein YsdA (DUF1294 family)